VKASRPKSNFRIIKQMNNNAMHISANTKGHLLLLIEQSKHEYRKKLGSKGACRHADPENLSIAFGINTISIELTYTEVTSPIGFPFNRLICKLRLDGAAISLKQLKEELNND
jgi:translation elongation factor EF-1beta